MSNLPTMEHVFEMNNLKGSITGNLYKGSFTFHRLNIGDRGKAEVLKCRLNGDMKSLDPDVDFVHEMLSFLRYGIVTFPDWWRECGFGAELHDVNILEYMYKECMDYEKKWLEKLANVGSRGNEDNSPSAA